MKVPKSFALSAPPCTYRHSPNGKGASERARPLKFCGLYSKETAEITTKRPTSPYPSACMRAAVFKSHFLRTSWWTFLQVSLSLPFLLRAYAHGFMPVDSARGYIQREILPRPWHTKMNMKSRARLLISGARARARGLKQTLPRASQSRMM